jgi:predicted transcriptional regulator
MRFKGIENDCFLKLVASRDSGLNLSLTRVILIWAANKEDYDIPNQQVVYESGIQASNVSRAYKDLCEGEWLVSEEIRRNKWDHPITRYSLHPKRWNQIREMVNELESKNKKVILLAKSPELTINQTQQSSDLEKWFEDFVLKYNLRNKESRVNHGNNICRTFFIELKSKGSNLVGIEILKSKYVGLFCHKSKAMSVQQFEEWRSELSGSWNRNLKEVFGENIIKVLKYAPNPQITSLIENSFTELDWQTAYDAWMWKYDSVAFQEFKMLYSRDVDIDIQQDPTNTSLDDFNLYLQCLKERNQRYAVKNKDLRNQESLNPKSNIKYEAKVEGDIITTDHLIFNIPSEDEEGDPYYIPPEERIDLKPEDCAPIEYDLEFCKLIGVDLSRS